MKDWPLYIIIGLLILLIFQQRCAAPDQTRTEDRDTSIVSIHHHYDSITKFIPVPVPQPKDSIFIPVPANVDTAAILKSYFAVYDYEQQISDSNITATIKDKVSQNRILFRDFTYQWKRPTVIETVMLPEVEKKRVKVFAGIHFGGTGLITPLILGPEVALLNKKDGLYTIRSDLLNRSIEAGVLFKISLNKK